MAASQRRATARRMGTDAEVVVRSGASPGPDPERVLDRLDELERRWSRFLPDSEVSVLNGLGGAPGVVGPDTATLLAHAAAAADRTGWAFDPLLGAELVRLGYDRSFPWAARDEPHGDRDGDVRGVTGRRDRSILIDERTGLAQLPAGAAFDPGGLGKGLAADVTVAEALVGAGPDVGLLVSVGGDLRVGGAPPAGGWEVAVDHLVGPEVRVALSAGALATSSVLRRRWTTRDGAVVHHVIDPRTCRPVDGPVVSVSVLADEAWWAEALATAVLVEWSLDGPTVELTKMIAGCGVLVTVADGTQSVVGARGREFMVVADTADETADDPDDDTDDAVRAPAVAARRRIGRSPAGALSEEVPA